jgi:hypothetical protein
VGGQTYVCQEAGCGHRAEGIRGIECHMEERHPLVAEEDWAYSLALQPKEGGKAGKRPREEEPVPGNAKKRPKEEELAPGSSEKRARVECDVSANFDLTGLGEVSASCLLLLL